MKYISGNLNFSSYENIKNALSRGTGDAIEKNIPQVLAREDETVDYLGECIFILHYDIEDTDEHTLYLNNILPKRVFLDSEEIDPSENIQSLTPGEHIVEVYSSRYWEEINEVLFDDLPGLKKIEFPRPLKRFGLTSIQNCPNLETLVFGKNVEDLIYPEDGRYFLDCFSLNKIQINRRNKNIVLKEGKYIFSKNDEFLLSIDGTLPAKGVKSLQRGWTGKTTFNNLVIPDSIKTLGESVFEGCTFTGSLTLGEGLKIIKEKAFYNIDITKLDTLTIRPQDPPTIESPQYFDLRDIDENGDPISGVDFEVSITEKGLSPQYSTWSNYIGFFDDNEFKFKYLTFEAIESGTFTFSFNTATSVDNLSYSLNNGNTWTTVFPKSTNTITTPTVSAGNTIIWKGTAKNYGYYNPEPGFNYSRFKSTGKYNISGNILSLFYGDYFVGRDSFPVDSSSYSGLDASCAGLFSGYYTGYSYEYSSVVDAHNLILPNTVTGGAYASMFAYCNYLTTAPELPAKTLATSCYQWMFQDCTSLTTAPELPAITLANGCYGYMFKDCTNLNYIKALFTTVPGTSYTDNWVSGVDGTGTFVKNSSASWNVTGTNGIPSGWDIEYSFPENYDWFTTTAIDDAIFTLTIPNQISTTNLKYIEYSTNDGATWTKIQNSDSQIVTITTPTVSAGNSVKWRGVGTVLGHSSKSSNFSSSGRYNIGGILNSLISCSENLSNYNYTFSSLFKDSSNLISAKNLSLPSTTMTQSCYQYMFSGCTALTTAPTLPATRLELSCYQYMFSGCTALTTPPELNATTLANNCYASMFSGCTSLTTAPQLPATTLKNNCYNSMFSGCTALTTAPELPATTLANQCYIYMFRDCTALTTASTLPATRLVDNCYTGMFHGCTALTTAPVLPATTLENSCYYSMFSGCTSLTTAPTLPATLLKTKCYYHMFYGCTSLIMTPELPATTLASDCYAGMFRNCTALITAPVLPATTLATQCYSEMFSNCTSLTTAPELPATTLANNCYYSMFSDCTSLNYIKAMFTNTPTTAYTKYWVQNVAAVGTFVKNSAATWNVTGTYGIPSGWTVETASS